VSFRGVTSNHLLEWGLQGQYACGRGATGIRNRLHMGTAGWDHMSNSGNSCISQQLWNTCPPKQFWMVMRQWFLVVCSARVAWQDICSATTAATDLPVVAVTAARTPAVEPEGGQDWPTYQATAADPEGTYAAAVT
jgi:hypothetical protein